MQNLAITPNKSLNKAYRRQKISREAIDSFKANLNNLLLELDEQESEEHVKNDVTQFLNDTWYKGEFLINTKGRTDLVIHNDKSAKSNVGVLLEVKKPSNKSEMVSNTNLNKKALQELVLYYLRERIEGENGDIKHLVVTNVYEWFIFDASAFYKHFYEDKGLIKSFKEWNTGQKDSPKTDLFYKEIAGPVIEKVKDKLEYTHFDLRTYAPLLGGAGGGPETKLISLYKMLSPTHLLKQPFANDSNSLDKQFYHELLHIIGLEEVKDGGKKVIQRKAKGKRNEGSLLENAINIIEERDRLRNLNKPSRFGETTDDQRYNVALELAITWVNRILFLKLLESQLVGYHKGDKNYRFLSAEVIPNYDALDQLFFGVLAKKHEDRTDQVKDKLANIPYLNSSLFEPTELESVLEVTQLNNNIVLELYTQTVLKNEDEKRVSGSRDTLTYLFDFLDAYDFSSEGTEEIQEDTKSLINASVLGLIFEKINGYKDGSFYTPGFITMYMCKETIRRAVIQKFNEAKGWELKRFDQLYDKIEDKKEANQIINSLHICDPAVGSGHFLVSALNEIIAIKSELKILMDKDGKTLRDYDISIENDELVIEDDNEELFQYTVGSKEKQRVQETLFNEKQTIIENCLFGVDINPNSVKICRLRLWIELLKNAYYVKNPTGFKNLSGLDTSTLQTLPNIDINIKCGNSLISRFGLDTDLHEALKKSKWNIDTYKVAVDTYRNATSKDEKREMERLIADIKSDFRSEISRNDSKVKKLYKLSGELAKLTTQTSMFDMSAKEKKEWNKKVEKLTKDTTKLETTIEEIKSNKIYDNAFEWRFEFPEVLNDEGDFTGFDAVIGNPPYIRQEEFKEIKSYLQDHFSTFTGTADLFIYFIELGIKNLKSSGEFTFIVPNKWMRAGYGKNLRQSLKNYKINSILDFGDLPVFEEATTYPCILSLSKKESVESFEALSLETLNFPKGLDTFVSDNHINVLVEELQGQGWTLTDSKVQKLLSKLKSKGTPLGEYVDGKIFRGVLTGLNEAFVIDTETKDRLIQENPNSAELIKPFLAGRDIKRYQQPKSDKYLILIPKGFTIKRNLPETSPHFIVSEPTPRYGDMPYDEAWEWFSKKYSSVAQHLLPYRKNAQKRTDQGDYWWELRACDYYDEFEKEKVMLPDISKRCEACIDFDNNYYSVNTAYIIPGLSKSDLGILNSKLVLFYYSALTQTIRGGYFRFIRQYLEQIPIIKTAKLKKLVTEILTIKKVDPTADTSALEREIDQLVYQLYGLTDEEIAIVEGSYNQITPSNLVNRET